METLDEVTPYIPDTSLPKAVIVDIDGTVAALQERGVQFTQPVFDTPFGKFARFNDPDGNGWQLHEGP